MAVKDEARLGGMGVVGGCRMTVGRRGGGRWGVDGSCVEEGESDVVVRGRETVLVVILGSPGRTRVMVG